MRALLLLLPPTVLGVGCTAVVVSDLLADRAPCAEPRDCAAGFVCEGGACTPAPEVTLAPLPGTPVGPEGGVVSGPDGVTLVLPAGALATTVSLRIERESSTLVPRAVDDVTPFYRVLPAAQLAAAAVLSIPVDGACDGCALFSPADAPDEPWSALDLPAVAPAGAVSGELFILGDVVVGGRRTAE